MQNYLVYKVLALRIGSLNVRTLGEVGVNKSDVIDKTIARLPIYLAEFRKQGVAVCLLQECRVRGPVDINMEGYKVFFSNIPEGIRRYGVGIAIKQEWGDMVNDWKFVNSRIMWIAGCFDGVYMAFICHYAPTMDISNQELRQYGKTILIDEHYLLLSQALNDIPKKYTRRYVGGDANGRIGGVDSEVWETEMGEYIIDNQNNSNGICMLEFCKKEQFCVANSIFSQDMHGSATYRAPGEQEFTRTIDYILVQGTSLQELVNCRVVAEVDFADTDHRLVIVDIIIKRQAILAAIDTAQTKRKTTARPDYSALKNQDTKDTFNKRLVEEMAVKTLNERCRELLRFDREVQELEAGASQDCDVVEKLYLDCLECIKITTEDIVPNHGRRELSKSNWFAKNRGKLMPLIKKNVVHMQHGKQQRWVRDLSSNWEWQNGEYTTRLIRK